MELAAVNCTAVSPTDCLPRTRWPTTAGLWSKTKRRCRWMGGRNSMSVCWSALPRVGHSGTYGWRRTGPTRIAAELPRSGFDTGKGAGRRAYILVFQRRMASPFCQKGRRSRGVEEGLHVNICQIRGCIKKWQGSYVNILITITNHNLNWEMHQRNLS